MLVQTSLIFKGTSQTLVCDNRISDQDRKYNRRLEQIENTDELQTLNCLELRELERERAMSHKGLKDEQHDNEEDLVGWDFVFKG